MATRMDILAELNLAPLWRRRAADVAPQVLANPVAAPFANVTPVVTLSKGLSADELNAYKKSDKSMESDEATTPPTDK